MGAVFSFPDKTPRGDIPEPGAWEVYRALAQASIDRPELMVDPDHSMALARAWKRWRDLFVMGDVG